MKSKILMLLAALCAASGSFAASAASATDEAARALLGVAQPKRYYLINGEDVVERHSDKIVLDGITARSLLLANQSYNGMPMKAPLNLSTDQSSSEFERALTRSGLYSKERETELTRKADWEKKFLLNSFSFIVHRRDGIEYDANGHRYVCLDLGNEDSGIVTRLSLFQTEAEFTAALASSELLVGTFTGECATLSLEEVGRVPAEFRHYLKEDGAFFTSYQDRIILDTVAFSDSVTLSAGYEFLGVRLARDVTLSASQSLEESLAALEATGLYSREYDADVKRKANWSDTFIMSNYLVVTHSKESVVIGEKTALGYYLTGSIECGDECINLSKPLNLNVGQTREEFVQAMIESGAFDPEQDAARRWTGVYELEDGGTIEHTPFQIRVCDLTGTRCDASVNGTNTRLRLDVFQTREQFEAELRRVGAID